jgi:hypothetical protein
LLPLSFPGISLHGFRLPKRRYSYEYASTVIPIGRYVE